MLLIIIIPLNGEKRNTLPVGKSARYRLHYHIILPAGSSWNFVSWHSNPYRVTGGAHGYLFQQYMSESKSGSFTASGTQTVGDYMFSAHEQNWGFITRI